MQKQFITDTYDNRRQNKRLKELSQLEEEFESQTRFLKV